MSNLWTPGSGEQPPRKRSDGVPRPPFNAFGGPASQRRAPSGADSRAGHDHGSEPAQEEQQAAEAFIESLASAPAVNVITNHIVQLFELARLYLSQQPPKMQDAALSIDAMNALVEGLEGLLGEGEEEMKSAVGGLRMFYLQIRAAYPEDEADKPIEDELAAKRAHESQAPEPAEGGAGTGDGAGAGSGDGPDGAGTGAVNAGGAEQQGPKVGQPAAD